MRIAQTSNPPAVQPHPTTPPRKPNAPWPNPERSELGLCVPHKGQSDAQDDVRLSCAEQCARGWVGAWVLACFACAMRVTRSTSFDRGVQHLSNSHSWRESEAAILAAADGDRCFGEAMAAAVNQLRSIKAQLRRQQEAAAAAFAGQEGRPLLNAATIDHAGRVPVVKGLPTPSPRNPATVSFHAASLGLILPMVKASRANRLQACPSASASVGDDSLCSECDVTPRKHFTCVRCQSSNSRSLASFASSKLALASSKSLPMPP